MSIENEILRIKEAKQNIANALIEKGVSLNPNDIAIDELPSVIEEMSVVQQPNSDYPVLFIDYDGTVLYSFTLDEFERKSIPRAPEQVKEFPDIIVGNGWNWENESDIRDYVDSYGNIVVGATYGCDFEGVAIRLKISDPSNTATFKFSAVPQSSRVLSYDWGDDSSTEYNPVGNGSSTYTYIHEYSANSDSSVYIVKLTSTDTVNLVSFETKNCSIDSIIINSDNLCPTFSIFDVADQLGINSAFLGRGTNALTCEHDSGLRKLCFLVEFNGPYVIDTGHKISLSGVVIPRIYSNNETPIQITGGVGLEFVSIPYSSTMFYEHMVGGLPFVEGADIVSSGLSNNQSLRRVNVVPGTTEIDSSMFYNDRRLETVTIPDSVESIGEEAFKGVTFMGDFELPTSVVEVGESAFEGVKMNSITFNGDVESIDSSAITDAKSVYLKSKTTAPNFGYNLFGNTENVYMNYRMIDYCIDSSAFIDSSNKIKVLSGTNKKTFSGLEIAPMCLCRYGSGYMVPIYSSYRYEKYISTFQGVYTGPGYAGIDPNNNFSPYVSTYYVSYDDLKNYFDSGSNLNSLSIDNKGNLCSYDGINDWRLPTNEEISAIFSLDRPGSNFVGYEFGDLNVHYELVALTKKYPDLDSSYFGILLFPDNVRITGSYNVNEIVSDTSLYGTFGDSESFKFSKCENAGSIFLPFVGIYDNTDVNPWKFGGTRASFWTADNSTLDIDSSGNISINPISENDSEYTYRLAFLVRGKLRKTWEDIPETNGVYIYYTDGTSSNYDTLIEEKTPVGVILKNDYVNFIIYPNIGKTACYDSATSSPRFYDPDSYVNDVNAAKNDYSGFKRTRYMTNIYTNNSTQIFYMMSHYVWADGVKGGYVASCGEIEQIILNVSAINEAMTLIGGSMFDFDPLNKYGSST